MQGISNNHLKLVKVMKRKILNIQIIMALCLTPALFLAQAVNAQPAEPYDHITQGYWGSGRNDEGQVGHEPAFPGQPGEQVDSLVLIKEDVAKVAGGDRHHYFITSDGTLWGSGANWGAWYAHGQLGLGDTTITSQLTPVEIAENVTHVEAGRFTGCFIKSDSTLWTMGYNGSGNLGDGTTDGQYSPVQVAENIIDADMGQHFTVFVDSDNVLWAVGRQGGGRLGNGEDEDIDVLEPVQVDTDVVRVFAGWQHTLYLKADGTLWAFGENEWGKLGIGEDPETTPHASTPQQVDSDVVYASAKAHTSYYIKADGTLYGMGSSFRGNLGFNHADPDAELEDSDHYPNPTPIEIATNVATVGAGARHVLYITNDGALMSAGHNNSNQLGFPGGSLYEGFAHIANIPNVAENTPAISGSGGSTMVLADPAELPTGTSAEEPADQPHKARLDQNYPNPFNPTTEISYTIPNSEHVQIEVFNMLGQQVATLVNDTQNAGTHSVTFDATNLSSGMYLYRIQTGSFVETRKMMLVK